MVFINIKNINKARPSVKLNHHNIGLYKITRVLSPLVYELELPTTMQIWPYFYINLLKLAPIDLIINQRTQPRPPVVANDGLEEWFIDAILDSRINRRRRGLLEYLVQWEEGQEPT